MEGSACRKRPPCSRCERIFPQLTVRDEAQRERIEFAAQVLLDSVAPEAPLRCHATGDGQAPALLLAEGVSVGEDELNDVFAAVTLERELATGRRDKVGRFDEHAIAWDTSKPRIDLMARGLASRLAGAGEAAADEPGPFRVIVSHDVDWTNPWEPCCLLKSLLRSMGLRDKNWLPLATALKPRAFVDNVQRLIEFESGEGIGACYFMLAGPYGFKRHSSRYDVHWRTSRKVGEAIRQAGMTLGLHGSYYACQRGVAGYREEKDRLEQALGSPVTCHRNHYLRFDSTRLWSQLEAAGIDYDFSVGFRTRLGFRAGSARAVRTFDLTGTRQTKVLSIPLLYMDTLLADSTGEELLPLLEASLREVKKVGGCVSVLFHPELFLVHDKFRQFFEEVIVLCKQLGADLSGKLPHVRPHNVHPDARAEEVRPRR